MTGGLSILGAAPRWPLVHACIPFAPDSNLVCLALNPRGNTRIDSMNRFVRQLHDQMRIDFTQPVQSREFFGSTTTHYASSEPARLRGVARTAGTPWFVCRVVGR